jgi:trehalose-6-phosphate synthase
VGIRPVPRLSRVQPSDAWLIVVSNRLPLTLRKADGGWNTERSSGGLASAMNPLLRKGGGDWIGWAGDSQDEDKESRQAVLKEWRKRTAVSRSTCPKR